MSTTHREKFSSLTKFFAWLNIGTQIAFPLAIAFTPAVVSAKLSEVSAATRFNTHVYTLRKGENVSTVAGKYKISVEELRKLNQLRTFARGFDNIHAGDEIDVPAEATAAKKQTKKTRALAERETNATERKIAGVASHVGSALNNSDSSTMSSMFRGMAVAEMSAQIQEWLGGAGTARVQLDADENFSFKNSQLDLLVPLYDKPEHLIFTQGSVHRTDERMQANLGLGYRWFNGSWMLGGNTFLDYDISHGNARMGLGMEYGRDFLKFGANSYLRLTNWRDAPDLEDYEERPANGWDVRAQAWLPALPQLGGKLVYEQYYGKEVALFGKNERQSNPHAVTVGVNYTPFPLLTLNADHRQGTDGNNDTQFGVTMNYQLGMPWQQQIDPAAVGAMRSLKGSRYDLVERNNNIVLEYRKKVVIRLRTAELITGYAGQMKSLGVAVNSKYALDRIDWTAPAFIAAGGKIIKENLSSYSIVLPDYQSGPNGNNTYTISGVAVDEKGNTSARASTQVTVTQAAIELKTSSLTPENVLLPADGKTQQALLLKIADREGKPVDVAVEELSVENSAKVRGAGMAMLTPFTRRAAGEYVATVTAGTLPESFSITPSARNSRFSPSNIVVVADKKTALVSALSIEHDGALADGKAENSVKVVLMDAQKNPVPSQAFNLSANNSAVVSATASTNNQGEAIVPVTSVHAGVSTLTASINGSSKNVALTFNADQQTAQVTNKDLSVLPAVSVADGKARKTVRVVVTDAHANPIPDAAVTFAADNGAILGATSVKTDAQGVAQTTLTSKMAGLSHVTATINNKSATQDTTFTGNTATALVNAVTTTASNGLADGTTGVKFQAVIKDQNNNLLTNVPVDWKSDRDNNAVTFSVVQSRTNDQGIAETTVFSTKAYDVVVTASTNASSKAAAPFTFIADTTKGSITQLSSNRQTLTANGKESAVLTAKVADRFGNPLSGVTVSLSNGQGAIITPVQATTDTNGTVQVDLTTQYAGTINVTAALDNGAKSTLALNAVADNSSATVAVNTSSLTATVGGSPVTMTAKVVDAHNNPVIGTSVAWRSDYNQLDASVSTTNDRGEATVHLSATQAVLTTVTAVLYNGNKATAQTTFAPAAPVTANSLLSVLPQTITADGSSASTATLTLRDRFGNPVPAQNISWSANESSVKFTPSEKGDGVYLAQITGTKEGTWSLTATSGSATLQTSLGFLANQNTALIDSVTVYGKDTAKADGVDTVTLRVQVKDKNGNTAMPGVAVGWRTALGTLSAPLSKTDAQGVAEIRLSSTLAGQVTVAALLGGGQPVNADKSVTFSAGTVSATTSSLSVLPGTIVSEAENATVTVTARDAFNNPLSGLSGDIALQYAPDLSLTASAFSEVAAGTYQAQLTGKNAGTTTITALVQGTALAQKAMLTLEANNNSAVVSGAISVTPASAVVGDTVTYSAVLTDKNGNALGAGIPVTWSANGGSMLSAQITNTDSTGKVQVTLTRDVAGTATVSLMLPSGATAAPNVVFSADAPDESQSVLTLTPAVIIAGKETATLQLVLRDNKGNLLTGQSVSGMSNNADVTIANAQETAKGTYTMTVSSNKMGTATLSVKASSTTFKQTKSLTIKGDTSSWKVTQITPNRTSFTAGDAQGVTYSATVVDAQGNTLPDVVVSWQLAGKADSFAESSRTNQSGVATSQVLSKTAGLLNMSVWLDPTNHANASVVTVNHGAVDASHSSFTADKTDIGADGIDAVTMTVRLNDSYDNPIAGKTVTMDGGSALSGFTVSSVTDNQDGSYTVKGTSTAKGQVTLSAKVDGKTIGAGITIDIGPINLNLSFANAQQGVTWMRNFQNSQAVKGLPSGLTQTWVSSDDSVAKVDGTGKVTLLKSGDARITVYTAGNAQYNPAIASYDLTVEKADPQMSVTSGNLMTSTWGDGKSYTITAQFGNSDADSMLTTTYKSDNTAIVQVDSKGDLTSVKPGAAMVTLSTPETEQFKAATYTVAYVLNKATPTISFKNASQTTKIVSGSSTQLQTPDITGIAASNLKWTSSNTSVASISGDKAAFAGGLGDSVITAEVLADDYYIGAKAQYTLSVYDSPSASLAGVTHTSLGDNTSGNVWQPVMTSDVVQATVTLDGDEKTRPVTKIVTTLYQNGVERGSFEMSGRNIKYGTPMTLPVYASNAISFFAAEKNGSLKTTITGVNNEVLTLPEQAITFSARTKDMLRMVEPRVKMAQRLWDTDPNPTTICSGNDWATLAVDINMPAKPGLLSYYSSSLQYRVYLNYQHSESSWGTDMAPDKGDKGMLTPVPLSTAVAVENNPMPSNYLISAQCGRYSLSTPYMGTYQVHLEMSMGPTVEDTVSPTIFSWQYTSPTTRPPLQLWNF
ncbi:Ig-like domain-containing protein [Vagococcus sp. WN89Y]|uniref:Ig-like domain-containing protein n=1 Tax=Vagococcus sp. WN89Y TaxID=3457258 RepID=UPI003FCDA903